MALRFTWSRTRELKWPVRRPGAQRNTDFLITYGWTQ